MGGAPLLITVGLQGRNTKRNIDIYRIKFINIFYQCKLDTDDKVEYLPKLSSNFNWSHSKLIFIVVQIVEMIQIGLCRSQSGAIILMLLSFLELRNPL